MQRGRPLKFKTAEDLQQKIDEFMDWCEHNERPPTIARLATFLDVDRHTIYNYEQKDDFFHTIKRAREKILAHLEEELMIKGNSGQIFLAKNYGYTDKQEVENTNYNHDISDESAKAYLKKHGMID